MSPLSYKQLHLSVLEKSYFVSYCRRYSALGNLKASFHCARLRYLLGEGLLSAPSPHRTSLHSNMKAKTKCPETLLGASREFALKLLYQP